MNAVQVLELLLQNAENSSRAVARVTHLLDTAIGCEPPAVTNASTTAPRNDAPNGPSLMFSIFEAAAVTDRAVSEIHRQLSRLSDFTDGVDIFAGHVSPAEVQPKSPSPSRGPSSSSRL